MSEKTIFQLLKDSKELTSLPQVLVEVIRVVDQDDCSTDEIARVIMRDPALTARLLRIANSPFYGPAREISTINQAVMTLGTRAVKTLALSTSLYKFFDAENEIIDRTRFWRHSLEVAIASREIAQACAYRPSEEAFVAGLLHDIGLLILEANFTDQFKRLWKLVESGESLIKLEQEYWNTTHAKVGKFLLDQWHIPGFIGEVIGAHHDVFDKDDVEDSSRLTRIVALGDMISKFRTCQMPPPEPEEIERIDALAESLGIGKTTFADLQEKILSKLISESEFLDIKIGSVTDLLLDANDLIYKQYLMVESVLSENRKMQAQLAREQMKKAALESLKAITATLSHYINNASATILGRAQLVGLAIKKGNINDDNKVAYSSMLIIEKSVEMISLVLEELKSLSSFDITQYHDETQILDIEDRLKKQIEAIELEKKRVGAPIA